MDDNSRYILIVENHNGLRRSLGQWLKSLYPQTEILEAETGEQALRQVWKYPVNVILMDIGLPGMNGIEATREIKKIAPDIQIIMVTIEDSNISRDAAELAGANGYINKRRLHQELMPVLNQFMTAN